MKRSCSCFASLYTGAEETHQEWMHYVGGRNFGSERERHSFKAREQGEDRRDLSYTDLSQSNISTKADTLANS